MHIEFSALRCMACGFALLMAQPVTANTWDMRQLTELSLEQLMDIDIRSVSEQAQQALSKASAAYIITAEDIRRSGRTTIPEILRLAPGVHVARVDTNKWAVGMRGFNSRLATKFLVLIDGRSMFSRSMPGIFWDQVDTMIEDIERIEVIRGPGASLWGSNAVQGVINVVTKSAESTQGGLISLNHGSHTDGGAAIRYGTRIGESGHLRVFSKHIEYAAFDNLDGESEHNEWRRSLLGFRFDQQSTSASRWRISAEMSQNHPDELLNSIDYDELTWMSRPSRNRINTYHGLIHWSHQVSDSNQLSVQFYIESDDRNTSLVNLERTTYDLDFKQQLNLNDQHNLIWGIGYRESHDMLRNTGLVAADPEDLTVVVSQAFLQDEIKLGQGLTALLGVKLEDNTFSDIEIQPSLKLSWQAKKQHLFWSSVAKAVRTPSRAGTQITLTIPGLLLPSGSAFNPFPLTGVVELAGNKDLESEELMAYELGYRWQAPQLSFDLALFYNDYTKLHGTSFGNIMCKPGNVLAVNDPTCLASADYAIFPLIFQNSVSGHTSGAEFSLRWQVSDSVQLDLNSSYIDYSLDIEALGFQNELAEQQNPSHLANLRINYQHSDLLEFDIWLRHVGKIQGLNGFSLPISSYTSVDLRTQWRISRNVSLNLSAQNLVDQDHFEFSNELGEINNQPIPRTISAELRVLF